MILGTYNGVNIIAIPSSPGNKEVEIGMNDSNSMSRSPFSGLQQIQTWSGGDSWDATIVLPKLVRKDAAIWSAWLAECRGIRNVFWIGDTTKRSPNGNASGDDAPVADGVQNAMLGTLNTKGWRRDTALLLLPGDMIQIGTHLHQVLDVVSSDGNGDAAIAIWPNLREATTDAEPIILNNPRGLFRLADNRRSIMSNETGLAAVTFRCIEAR